MPDGSQQPVDPAAERANEQMRDWKEKHHDPSTDDGWWSSIGASIGDFMAAAEAGAFAVSPDTGAAIIKQLGDVQNQVAEIQRTGAFATGDLRLGGGYATNIATFNQQVTKDGPGTMLQKFADELEQLKSAVNRSIANYGATDSTQRGRVDSAGDGL
jgi:hypothetical protein